MILKKWCKFCWDNSSELRTSTYIRPQLRNLPWYIRVVTMRSKSFRIYWGIKRYFVMQWFFKLEKLFLKKHFLWGTLLRMLDECELSRSFCERKKKKQRKTEKRFEIFWVSVLSFLQFLPFKDVDRFERNWSRLLQRGQGRKSCNDPIEI